VSVARYCYQVTMPGGQFIPGSIISPTVAPETLSAPSASVA